jgi:hypothetical protein
MFAGSERREDDDLSALAIAVGAADRRLFAARNRAGSARYRQPARRSSDKPAADLIAAALGPLFYRRWFSKEGIDDRFVAAIIAAAIEAAVGKKRGSGR